MMPESKRVCCACRRKVKITNWWEEFPYSENRIFISKWVHGSLVSSMQSFHWLLLYPWATFSFIFLTSLKWFGLKALLVTSHTVLQISLRSSLLRHLNKLWRAMELSCSVMQLAIQNQISLGQSKEMKSCCLRYRFLTWPVLWEKTMEQCTHVSCRIISELPKLLLWLQYFVSILILFLFEAMWVLFLKRKKIENWLVVARVVWLLICIVRQKKQEAAFWYERFMRRFNGNLNEHNQMSWMTAFLFLESVGEKKRMFVKSSRFLATVWLRRGMEIAQNAVYNSTSRLHSVTKFSYLYVQKAKFWPVALSLPSSSASLPLFDGHWLKFILVGKGFGKTKDGWLNKISSVRLSGHFCIFFFC